MTSAFWDNVLFFLGKLEKSQIWLSGKSTVGKTVINSGISRKSSPSVDNAIKIARALGVTVEYLIDGKDADGLTVDEMELLDKYRSLSGDNQHSVRVLIDSMLPAAGVGEKGASA